MYNSAKMLTHFFSRICIQNFRKDFESAIQHLPDVPPLHVDELVHLHQEDYTNWRFIIWYLQIVLKDSTRKTNITTFKLGDSELCHNQLIAVD